MKKVIAVFSTLLCLFFIGTIFSSSKVFATASNNGTASTMEETTATGKLIKIKEIFKMTYKYFIMSIIRYSIVVI